ncbi:sulfate adenylyltransferase subunit CysN [Methylocystis sp. Sn-Cys]|uniref:sulfate adenylyltransferase subunit CysN n=1 Tax=Methylocystis sp. Sn-Cys TaxID=1701263 RepID=UPI001921A970|nr:sulfate adenylyltransferase subunit CysN [Methylocystis sp. Sn-Cys]MBL1258579.1 sulfate adenylyltransferase subunit CysN [Methylocystis sp. Sn-Cys]
MQGVEVMEAPAPAVARIAADKPLLRFITCGSVDDGKSTLIGRLLYDANLAPDDLIAALEADSKKHGTQGDDLDFALLVDGLAAEREQGITIDVAYRYFATDKRKFIVADTPGHEQYTRNMAVGSSTADLAILLVDARKGILPQTRRHSVINSMFGVRHVVVAVNKMDLVGYSEDVFRKIVADFHEFAKNLHFASIYVVPLVAKDGDNLVHSSQYMPWHDGPSLLAYLEGVAVEDVMRIAPFRMPVQWVNRPNLDFRGFSGFISGGNIRPGDIVRILPSGRDTRVSRVVTYDGDLESGVSGQSVTITLAEEIDCSRGDLLSSPVSPAQVGDRLEAKLLWLVREPLTTGKSYLLKIGTKTTPAVVNLVQSRIEIETGLATPLGAEETLAFNEIGEAQLSLETVVACDPYVENRETGGFILIDRITNETVAVGMVKEVSASSRRVAAPLADVSYASMEGVALDQGSVLSTPKRSLLKAASWLVPATLINFVIVNALLSDAVVSFEIAIAQTIAISALRHFHERFWTRSAFGLESKEGPTAANDPGI